MFMLNFTHFSLNTFWKKTYFELHLRVYTTTGFESYAVYKAKDETYSLDKLDTSCY